MSDKKILGYKIRHTETKLFLSSVSKNKWTKIGKTWPRRCDAIRAVNQGMSYLSRYKTYNSKEYDQTIDDIGNWEVVELVEASSFSVLFIIDKIKIGE